MISPTRFTPPEPPRPGAARTAARRRLAAAARKVPALLAIALLVAGGGSTAAATTTTNQLVVISNCDVTALKNQIATKLGVSASTIRIGYVMVYSDKENFGQRNSSGGQTGPILCVGPGYVANQSTPFPPADVNIFETGTSTRVRISTSPAASDPADVVNCEGFNGTEKCVLVDKP